MAAVPSGHRADARERQPQGQPPAAADHRGLAQPAVGPPHPDAAADLSAPNAGWVWVPGLPATRTTGPKTPFRYDVPGDGPLMSCVDAPGMTAVVTYTVRRATFAESISVDTTGMALAR